MAEEIVVRRLSVPPPALGRSKVGRYEIVCPLARGGMASVHVGRLSGMAGFEKLVAIKVIHPHLVDEEGFVEMFLDEARLAARIHHPNVGEVIEVGEDDGLLYMVSELIPGQSLKKLHQRAIERRVHVPLHLWAYIGSQVCRGLHEAHELLGPTGQPLHIVHRDISPQNVLVSYNGCVKLIDFGVALASERISHTAAGIVKGKIGFMPPEQISGLPMDRRSDLFSLGVTLYVLCTGAHPFPGRSDAERLARILRCEPKPPRRIDPRIDEALERIILKAMAKSPADRYSTAAEMGRELKAYVSAATTADRGWDGSVELASIMSRLFVTEIAQHAECTRRVASAASAVEETRRAELTALTAAGTPQSMWVSRQGRARRGTWKSLVPGASLGLACLAVILSVILRGMPGAEIKAAAPTPAVEAAAPRVTVSLSVEPSGAALALDGVPLPRGAAKITLPAGGGAHRLEATAVGYERFETMVIADRDTRLDIRLVPARDENAGIQDGRAADRTHGATTGATRDDVSVSLALVPH